jgi:hypothetical protein
MDIIRIAVGILLLLFGRRLFWLFVGAVGFVFGIEAAALVFPGGPDWIIIVIALLAGIVGALLAIFIQGLAIGLAGFLAGGYCIVSVLSVLSPEFGQFAWLGFLLGGIVGAVLVVMLFHWALIILSSLTGAIIIVQGFSLSPPVSLLLSGLLFVVGVAMQASFNERE